MTLKAMTGYGCSAVFGILAFVLIMYGPTDRAIASNIFSAAFLVLAAGLAGFTQLNLRAGNVNLQTIKREVTETIAKRHSRKKLAAAE